jgi:hypothetical protein
MTAASENRAVRRAGSNSQAKLKRGCDMNVLCVCYGAVLMVLSLLDRGKLAGAVSGACCPSGPSLAHSVCGGIVRSGCI